MAFSPSPKEHPAPRERIHCRISPAYWVDIFSQPRPDHRFEAADSSGMGLSVSCYGDYVSLPADAYLDAVRENQLVGVWLLKPEIVEEWIQEQIAKEMADVEVFEEYWLYIYRNV